MSGLIRGSAATLRDAPATGCARPGAFPLPLPGRWSGVIDESRLERIDELDHRIDVISRQIEVLRRDPTGRTMMVNDDLASLYFFWRRYLILEWQFLTGQVDR